MTHLLGDSEQLRSGTSIILELRGRSLSKKWFQFLEGADACDKNTHVGVQCQTTNPRLALQKHLRMVEGEWRNINWQAKQMPQS